ncbi:MAG: 4-hydroxy-tetrahydrodipicolinate reductase, partial [Bacteroidota bacterium]
MKLRIALVGYGRMGRAVEHEAVARGHEISHRIGRTQLETPTVMASLSPDTTDCIIEFTRPESAVENFRQLIPTAVPIVTGTTGWLEQLSYVEALVAAQNVGFLYSSNFSIGVNVLFKLNQTLARIMNAYPSFDCYITEAHHRHKKDAPSGTAISLGEQILAGLDRKSQLASDELRNRPPTEEELSVAYTRAGEIIGQHSVSYRSDIE